MNVEYVYCPQCASPLEPKEDSEGTLRDSCSGSDCGFVHYDNPTPVVAILPTLGDDAILARNKAWPAGMMSTITGFLEAREEPEAAARRELREELGLEAEAVELIGVYMFAPFNQVLIAYHIEASGTLTLGEEIAETKAVPLHKLKGWGFGPGLAVVDWLARRARDDP